jgi:hypothetical protein
MEYNSSRTRLLMPEYGRNVQKMVEYLLTIEDREKRLQQAKIVIDLMCILTPHLKTMEDYEHKLWDHLHQMTGLRLDVDAPYPAPTAEQLAKRPDVIPYPQSYIKHRHLGKNLQSLIKKGLTEPDTEKKQGYTQSVGYYMKLAYTNWHKEPVHDDMVKNELAIITDGEMKFETGGYRIPFDTRPSFKKNNNNNRNFKNNNNRKPNAGGGGGNPNSNNPNNKNRNFKNKNK